MGLPPSEAPGKDTDSQSGALIVGEWRVTPDLNQISRDSEIVHIEPKAMAVLLHLARRPGEVASREELLAAVWPGVIVGDNALTQVVIKLRRALGDTAREPTYIQAISKKGYRLIAAVAAEDGVPSAGLLHRTEEPPVRRPWHRAGAALGVIMFVGLAWWMLQAGDQPGSTRAPDPPLEAVQTLPTVVVKPFEPVGANDPQEMLLARAMTADLVTDLSKVSAIRVASGAEENEPAKHGAHAPARYLLTGTVQREADRLRLQVHLADAATRRQLWSERFDRRVQDLFSVQDELVRRIVAMLPVKLNDAQTARLAQRYTRNLDAYEQFLRGQAALLVRRRAQNELARESYWQAIRTDPAFSRAYAGLAMTYALDYQQGWAADGDSALSRALEFAETAKQISPDLPEAHWVLGFVRTQQRRHDNALRHLDDALRLNPSYADAHALKAGILTYVGRPAEAVPLLRMALRLNPDAGSLYFLLLGRAYYFLGDGEQARVNLDHALLRNSENLEARLYLAAAHWRAGQRDAAAWQAQEIRALEPGFKVDAWLSSYPMTHAAQRQQLAQALADIGLH